jgi:hypothetical protein
METQNNEKLNVGNLVEKIVLFRNKEDNGFSIQMQAYEIDGCIVKNISNKISSETGIELSKAVKTIFDIIESNCMLEVNEVEVTNEEIE